jgi:hypothetical protein
VSKVEPAQIDVKPKPESSAPVVITCVHCQSNFTSRGHEDYELVAGARPTGHLIIRLPPRSYHRLKKSEVTSIMRTVRLDARVVQSTDPEYRVV